MTRLLFEDEVTLLAQEYDLELPPDFIQDLWETLCRFEQEAADWGWVENKPEGEVWIDR